MSDDAPTDMSKIPHWQFKVVDPAGREFVSTVGERLADMGGRNYLIVVASEAIDILLDRADRERKVELALQPHRDVSGDPLP